MAKVTAGFKWAPMQMGDETYQPKPAMVGRPGFHTTFIFPTSRQGSRGAGKGFVYQTAVRLHNRTTLLISDSKVRVKGSRYQVPSPLSCSRSSGHGYALSLGRSPTPSFRGTPCENAVEG